MPLAARLAGLAWGNRRALIWVVLVALGLPLLLALLAVSLLGALAGQLGSSGPAFGPSRPALADIPAAYLALYQAAGQRYGLGWEFLAAIGKVETDHGRLRAPGVRDGENLAGAGGPMQFLAGTWATYGVDGNHDGDRDRHDPADAIPAAAHYLKASGAPGDWDRAIFAYNHASWYVADVKEWAERYRGDAQAVAGPGGGVAQELPAGAGRWLAPVPGSDAICDRRIVADLLALQRRYKLHLGDCFAMTGHELDGEHPLGLAVDLHPDPARGGTWADVDALAAWAEPAQDQPRRPFRWVGYNGDPDHGTGHHLHLSWEHTPAAPGQPADRVWTLLNPREKTP